MTRVGAFRETLAILFLGLLALSGCARPTPTPEAKGEDAGSARATAHQMKGSTITVVDPEGRWRFEAKAETVQAAGVEGPYTLRPAECRYQAAGTPPVLITAARAEVDKQARRVVLEGEVRIRADAWRLEAERVEYDLEAGEVVAPGRTKWTFGGEAVETEEPQSSEREGSP
jgi:LPS export ABC transporter protein LptC